MTLHHLVRAFPMSAVQVIHAIMFIVEMDTIVSPHQAVMMATNAITPSTVLKLGVIGGMMLVGYHMMTKAMNMQNVYHTDGVKLTQEENETLYFWPMYSDNENLLMKDLLIYWYQ